MRETLFKFLLSEVKAVRITCRHKEGSETCGGVIEAAIGQLSKIGKCPICGHSLEGADRLPDFMKAVQEVASRMDLAFVLPAETLDATPTDKK